MTDGEELRTLAQVATPGPWRLDGIDIVQLTDSGQGYPLDYYPDSKDVAVGKCEKCGNLDVGVGRRDDAAFIAACDPQTVVGLLDEIEKQRQATRDAWAAQHDAINKLASAKGRIEVLLEARDEACRLAETAITLKGEFIGRGNRTGSELIADLRKVGAP